MRRGEYPFLLSANRASISWELGVAELFYPLLIDDEAALKLKGYLISAQSFKKHGILLEPALQ